VSGICSNDYFSRSCVIVVGWSTTWRTFVGHGELDGFEKMNGEKGANESNECVASFTEIEVMTTEVRLLILVLLSL